MYSITKIATGAEFPRRFHTGHFVTVTTDSFLGCNNPTGSRPVVDRIPMGFVMTFWLAANVFLVFILNIGEFTVKDRRILVQFSPVWLNSQYHLSAWYLIDLASNSETYFNPFISTKQKNCCVLIRILGLRHNLQIEKKKIRKNHSNQCSYTWVFL